MEPTQQDHQNALYLLDLAYLTEMDALIIQHVKKQFLAGEVVQKNLYGAFKLICKHYFGSSE